MHSSSCRIMSTGSSSSRESHPTPRLLLTGGHGSPPLHSDCLTSFTASRPSPRDDSPSSATPLTRNLPTATSGSAASTNTSSGTTRPCCVSGSTSATIPSPGHSTARTPVWQGFPAHPGPPNPGRFDPTFLLTGGHGSPPLRSDAEPLPFPPGTPLPPPHRKTMSGGTPDPASHPRSGSSKSSQFHPQGLTRWSHANTIRHRNLW